jgi:hypothetical protein
MSWTATTAADHNLHEAANIKLPESFRFLPNKMLERLVIKRMEGKEDIIIRQMNDDGPHTNGVTGSASSTLAPKG